MDAYHAFVFMTSFISVGVLIALGISSFMFDLDRRKRSRKNP